MALDTDQRMKLELILEGTQEDSSVLSQWELGFVSSFATRYEQYGDDVLISAKQWNILDRIYDSIIVAAEAQA